MRNISLVHSPLGFVISLLLVFRTNTAYDRWWEGRKQWGMLVNTSRNLALKLDTLLGENQEEAKQFFQAMIPNFAFALKNHLRKSYKPSEFKDSDSFKKNVLKPE
jgi:putative membrane protein